MPASPASIAANTASPVNLPSMPYLPRLAGPATAAGGRDLRDWLHAASLPALMTGEAVRHEAGGIRPARPARYGTPGICCATPRRV